MPTRPVTVGTTATRIAAWNPRRTALSFFNNGTATIYISEDQGQILTEGFGLPAGGAVDLVRPPAGMDEPENAWYGIVAAATQNLRVLEQNAKPPVEVPGG